MKYLYVVVCPFFTHCLFAHEEEKSNSPEELTMGLTNSNTTLFNPMGTGVNKVTKFGNLLVKLSAQ